jgi:hypothetical protein
MSYKIKKLDDETATIRDLKTSLWMAFQHRHTIEPLPFPYVSGCVFVASIGLGVVASAYTVVMSSNLLGAIAVIGFVSCMNVLDWTAWLIDWNPTSNNDTSKAFMASDADEDNAYNTPKYMQLNKLKED